MKVIALISSQSQSVTYNSYRKECGKDCSPRIILYPKHLVRKLWNHPNLMWKNINK